MRTDYIEQYVSSHLRTEVSVYDSGTGALLRRILPAKESRSVQEEYPALSQMILRTDPAGGPRYTFVNGDVCFIHFRVPHVVYLIGPVRFQFGGSDLHARHTISDDAFNAADHPQIPHVMPMTSAECILLLYNIHQERDLTAAECFRMNFSSEQIHEKATAKVSEDLFGGRENDSMVNTWQQEVRLLKCIEEGDIFTLRQIWDEPVVNDPRRTSPDPVRSGRNMAIYNITACGRAAIRGGLSADYVFEVTETYAQQIEGLQNLLMLQPLVQDIQMFFASAVRDQKQHEGCGEGSVSHPLVRKAKDYVFRHLHSRLTVQEVADYLGVHPNFLTSLFCRQEGMPLYQYILAQKMDLAKNLLIYSDYSYIDIANYLGFTSQSHLGARFKAATGMTLREYRNKYKKEAP